MVKKKILYLMHVDWKWIFQRPHVIAKGLEQDYDVTVAYLFNYRQQRNIQKNNLFPEKTVKIYNIPYEGKNIFIYYLNKVWLRWYRHKFRKERYDLIWLTSPVMLRYIDKRMRGRIVYDCMDDEVAMRMDRDNNRLVDHLVLKNEYVRSKKYLLKRADIIFFSSQYLYIKFKRHCSGKAVLVRNGFQQSAIHYMEKKTEITKKQYHIGYVGTIESWLDINLLKKGISKYPDICYHLIGPCVISIKDTSNIIMEGITEHEQLYYKVAEYDCLIMPFKVNDIILAVDPVKLYEYISYGKCIISVYYPEIERFSDFVYFYHTEDEFVSLLQKLKDQRFKPKYSREQQIRFLYENTWEKRINAIRSVIDEFGRNI